MSEDADVRIERGLGAEGRVAVVHFDRGDRLNALSIAAMRRLRRAAESFEDDLATSVVILTGNAHCFSAGFDLADVEGQARSALPLGERRVALRAGPKMCAAWRNLDQVTIAAIEGHCIGGGVALVAALDFRVATHAAHFRVPEVALGMNMSWGSLPRLVQLMGPARTKQAVLFAEDRISAREAADWGLVEHLTEAGGALAKALDLADRLAALPPLAVAMTKTTIDRIAGAHDDLAVHMDGDQFALTTTSEDHAEAVRAFKGKRKGRYHGR
jgi:enoyl-CoA hydratase/carnithine racemase